MYYWTHKTNDPVENENRLELRKRQCTSDQCEISKPFTKIDIDGGGVGDSLKKRVGHRIQNSQQRRERSQNLAAHCDISKFNDDDDWRYDDDKKIFLPKHQLCTLKDNNKTVRRRCWRWVGHEDNKIVRIYDRGATCGEPEKTFDVQNPQNIEDMQAAHGIDYQSEPHDASVMHQYTIVSPNEHERRLQNGTKQRNMVKLVNASDGASRNSRAGRDDVGSGGGGGGSGPAAKRTKRGGASRSGRSGRDGGGGGGANHTSRDGSGDKRGIDNDIGGDDVHEGKPAQHQPLPQTAERSNGNGRSNQPDVFEPRMTRQQIAKKKAAEAAAAAAAADANQRPRRNIRQPVRLSGGEDAYDSPNWAAYAGLPML
jgi:hypothetical protein